MGDHCVGSGPPAPLEPSIPQRRRLPAPVGHGLLQVIHIKGAVKQADSHRSSSVKELTPRVRTRTSSTTTSAAMWKDSSNGKRRYFVIIYESQAVERSTELNSA